MTALGCNGPTEIVFTVTTDVPCTTVNGTSISVSTLASLPTQPPASTSAHCAGGAIGSLVVVPSGSDDAEVAVRVVTSLVSGQTPEDCAANGYAGGCIVARRALHFLPHSRLDVPVVMAASCKDIPCQADETCDNGQCVPATLRCSGTQCSLLADASAPPDLDATADASSAPEGSSDAALPDATGSPGSVVIDARPNGHAPSGTAQQQHLFYAANSGRWWMFSIDAATPSSLDTRWSKDFVSWADGPTFATGHGSSADGRDFSLAYANMANNDVVHIAFSHATGGATETYHSRAVIQGDTIAFAPEVLVNDCTPPAPEPDGLVTTILPDGQVYEASGWYNEEADRKLQGPKISNTDIFAASFVDTGWAWTSGMPHLAGGDQYVPNVDWNRAIIPVGSGQAMAVWPTAEYGGTQTTTEDLSWTLSPAQRPGLWSLPIVLFDPNPVGQLDPDAGMMEIQDQNDWSVCSNAADTVHAVRRKFDGTFEHRIFQSGTGAWVAGGALAADPGITGSGVVLLTNGPELLVFAIGTGGAIRYARWSQGGGWSAWSTLFGPAARSYLSGTGCSDPGHAAITWTEDDGATTPSYNVVGADVFSLF
jgi:hypothetical protein